MGSAVVIIVSGPPGAGKTTLAERIAEKFRLPLITKDGIKESLFDSLGTGDREWSRKLGLASYRLIWYSLESLLKVGNSLVVESNFSPEISPKRFLELQRKYDFKSLEVFCNAKAEIILERIRNRAESGERHMGHLDNIVDPELDELLLKGYRPLNISGDVVNIDTSDFESIDYHNLYLQIQRLIDA